MADVIEIRALDQQELEPYARLTEAQLRSRRTPEQGIFIAEGCKVIENALNAGCRPRSFLMERRHITGKARALLERCGDVPVYTGESSLLEQLTGFRLTRGVLSAMSRPELPSPAQLLTGAHRVAVLEGINDPTNVGAIFRSAAALGMDAVLVTESCCDPLHRRAVRVSMGTVLQVPWAYLEDWPQGGLAMLRQQGFRTAAMALDSRACSIEDPQLSAEQRLAIVLGAEGDGLKPQTIAECDVTVCIPMSHQVDSLNVAAASAVAFWQLRNL